MKTSARQFQYLATENYSGRFHLWLVSYTVSSSGPLYSLPSRVQSRYSLFYSGNPPPSPTFPPRLPVCDRRQNLFISLRAIAVFGGRLCARRSLEVVFRILVSIHQAGHRFLTSSVRWGAIFVVNRGSRGRVKSCDAQRIDRYAVCQRIADRFDSILALCSGETQVNSLHHEEVLSLRRLPSNNLNGCGRIVCRRNHECQTGSGFENWERVQINSLLHS